MDGPLPLDADALAAVPCDSACRVLTLLSPAQLNAPIEATAFVASLFLEC